MEYDEKVIENLEKSAQLRYDINEDYTKKMNSLKKQFEEVFGIDKKYFKLFKDIKYYRGGYPSETSPSKIDSMIEPIAELLSLSEFVNDLELKNKFKEYGISISFDSNIELKYSHDHMKRDDMIHLFNILLNDALETQGMICCKSDEIKITNYEEFNKISEVEIDKSIYKTIVNSYYRKIKELENEKIREKIKKSKESLEFAESVII
jgi:hypothetical protein